MVLLETYKFAYGAKSRLDMAFTFKGTYYNWIKSNNISYPLHKVFTTYSFTNTQLWTKSLRNSNDSM